MFFISDILYFIFRNLIWILYLPCLYVTCSIFPLTSWLYGIILSFESFLSWLRSIYFFLLLWIIFLCFFSCLVIFDWKPYIVSFPCLGIHILWSYKYSWVLFWNAVKLLGNYLLLLGLTLRFFSFFLVGPERYSSRDNFAPPWQGKPFWTLCSMLSDVWGLPLWHCSQSYVSCGIIHSNPFMCFFLCLQVVSLHAYITHYSADTQVSFFVDLWHFFLLQHLPFWYCTLAILVTLAFLNA